MIMPLPHPSRPNPLHPAPLRSENRRSLEIMEDVIYQYQRNMHDYHVNMRQMSNHLFTMTTTMRATAPPPIPRHLYSVSFEMLRQSPPPGLLTEAELQGCLRMSQYAADSASSVPCPISLERFQPGDEICEIVGCGHVFKREPALEWLRRTPVCPVCRFNLAPAEESATTTTRPPPSDGALGTMFQNFLQGLASELLEDSPVD